MKIKSINSIFKLARPHLLAAALVVLAVTPGLAQNFNIDCGNALGVPGAGYGGAAGMPGVWNNMPGAAPIALVDIAGVLHLTTIQIVAGGAAPFACNDPGTVGGDQTLYDDGLNIGLAGAMTVFQVGPLLAGTYEVITYAWGPCMPGYLTQVTVAGSASLPQTIGGAWPGGRLPCTTYAHHAGVVVPAGGFLFIQLTTLAGYGSLNGLQIIRR